MSTSSLKILNLVVVGLNHLKQNIRNTNKLVAATFVVAGIDKISDGIYEDLRISGIQKAYTCILTGLLL